METGTERFVERMGMLWEEDGLPRIAGRLFGFLLLQGEACSLDRLAEALEVSKASVSNDARRLEQLGLLQRSTRPGDRRDYYGVAPDIFTRSMAVRLERLRQFHGLLELTRALPVESAEVRARLAGLETAYQYTLQAIDEMLARWQQRGGSVA